MTSPGTSSLSNDFKAMYDDTLFFDYTLRTPSRSFQVHRNVLAARSPVFRAMLTSDMQEARSGTADISEVDDDTLHRLLIFIYTDSVNEPLCFEDARKLYSAADVYGVLSLKDKCGISIYNSISVSNACIIMAFAALHQDKELQEATLDFIFRNEQNIIGKEEWDAFEKENLQMANEILRSLYERRTKGERSSTEVVYLPVRQRLQTAGH